MLARTEGIYLLSKSVKLIYEEWNEEKQSWADRNDWEVHKQDVNPRNKHNLLITET